MPQPGNSFTIQLRETHLNWGTYRTTDTRPLICNEMYIPIPSHYSKEFSIYNSNYSNRHDILGINIFNCISSDGFLNCMVKTSGSAYAGDIHSKNLQRYNNLKLLVPWANHCQMQPGDQIEICWNTNTDVVLRYIPQ